MATPSLSTANSCKSFPSSTSQLASSSPTQSPYSSSLAFLHPKTSAGKRHPNLFRCFSESSEESPICPVVTSRRRSLTSICLITAASFSSLLINTNSGNAAILEADEDDELMEKIKQDRKKRIERQGLLTSSKQETGYLQEVVFKLSKAGQAIEKNDLPAATSVLGNNTDTDWVQKANLAFAKLSFDLEEKTQVDAFNSSLASLISSVVGNDIESSKVAFVASATAFEKWSNLTGIVTQLKGL
ncbi:Thylakoid lumenal 16.5 kDa protein, chloroplastic [Linum grandiflorum]